MLNHDLPLSIISSTLGDTLETTSNTYLKVDIKNLSKCNLEVDEIMYDYNKLFLDFFAI